MHEKCATVNATTDYTVILMGVRGREGWDKSGLKRGQGWRMGRKLSNIFLKKTNYAMMERIMHRRDETVRATEELSQKTALKPQFSRIT